jgi:uncharacterized metal-binding protein
MPGYKIHTSANLIALAGMSYLVSENYTVAPYLIGIGATSFALATLFLSPDLDLKHSSPTRNWGLLRFLWRPYQAIFKHRGLSHNIFFSSATRIGYLICVFASALIAARAWADPSPTAIFTASTLVIEPAKSVISTHGEHLTAVGVGIALSDTCHIITDRFVSSLKKLFSF